MPMQVYNPSDPLAIEIRKALTEVSDSSLRKLTIDQVQGVTMLAVLAVKRMGYEAPPRLKASS